MKRAISTAIFLVSFALAFLLVHASVANAASRFWVGGTGDCSDTAHWAASSGGAGGQSVPGSADTVTFDGNSGGGTVTCAGPFTWTSTACGAFTGTINFSGTFSVGTFDCSGTATRTINLGSSAWTVTAASGTVWTIQTGTNLTFNAGTSTVTFSATTTSARTIQFGNSALTYNNVTVAPNTSYGSIQLTGSTTFNGLTLQAPNVVFFFSGQTFAPSTLTVSGSAAAQVAMSATSFGSAATITAAGGSHNIQWASIQSLTFAGGATWAAVNSFNLGRNTGITITAPSGGGGGVFGG